MFVVPDGSTPGVVIANAFTVSEWPMLTLVDVARSVSVMVELNEPAVVGVPLMTPPPALIDKPPGRLLDDHEYAAAPP